MNTFEIANALRREKVTKNLFYGVYPSDKIPKNFFTRKGEGGIVFNFDASHLAGSHWVSVYKDNIGNVEYFDSYGLPPLHPNVIEMFRGKITYNNKRLQGFNSDVCGAYCLYFLYKKGQKKSLKTIVEQFGKNYCLNDNYVKVTVCDRFQTSIELCNRINVQYCLSYNDNIYI